MAVRYTTFGERAKIAREHRIGRKPMKFIEGRFEKTKKDKSARELAYESLLRELKKDEIGFNEQAAKNIADTYALGIKALQNMHMRTLAAALAIYNQMLHPQQIKGVVPLDPQFLDMKEEIIYDLSPHVDALLMNNEDFLRYIQEHNISLESTTYILLYSIRTMNLYIDRFIEYLTRDVSTKGRTEEEGRASVEEKARRNRAELLAYLRVIYLSQKETEVALEEFRFEEAEEGIFAE